MEKKFFLLIPLFFLLFSFLFPFKGGVDRYFTQDTVAGSAIPPESQVSAIPPFPGRECTCYLEAESFSAAGFLDGALLINENNSGFKVLDNRTPGKFQTVYSIAATEDARYLAVISGAYPRTLSVYQKKQETWNLVHRASMLEDVRRSTYLSFSGNLLLYEDKSGISVLNMTNHKRFNLAYEGALKEVAFDSSHGYVWVLFSDDTGKSFVHVFLNDGSLIASAPYGSNDRLRPYRIVEQ